MADDGSIRSLFVKLGIIADRRPLAEFDAGLTAIKASMTDIVGMAAVAGAGLTAFGVGLLEVTRETAEFGAAVELGAKRTGETVKSYQELKYAAEQTGASQGQLEMALRRLQVHSEGAALGKKADIKLFQEMGLSAVDAAGHVKSADDLLSDLAGRVQSLAGSPTAQVGIVSMLMGGHGGGSALLPLLEKGPAGLKALRDEADRLGLMTDADAQAALKFNQELKQTQFLATSLRNELGTALMPVLGDLLGEFRDWVVANRALIDTKIHVFADEFAKDVRRIAEAIYYTNEAVQHIGGWKVVLLGFGAAASAIVAGRVLWDLATGAAGIATAAGAAARGLTLLSTVFKAAVIPEVVVAAAEMAEIVEEAEWIEVTIASATTALVPFGAELEVIDAELVETSTALALVGPAALEASAGIDVMAASVGVLDALLTPEMLILGVVIAGVALNLALFAAEWAVIIGTIAGTYLVLEDIYGFFVGWDSVLGRIAANLSTSTNPTLRALALDLYAIRNEADAIADSPFFTVVGDLWTAALIEVGNAAKWALGEARALFDFITAGYAPGLAFGAGAINAAALEQRQSNAEHRAYDAASRPGSTTTSVNVGGVTIHVNGTPNSQQDLAMMIESAMHNWSRGVIDGNRGT